MAPAERGKRFPAALPLIAILTGGLTACGGGGGSDPVTVGRGPPITQDEPIVVAGQFKDVNVSGLSFTSGAQMGMTDRDGRFSCESDHTVSFSVGAVSLGTSTCADVVTPLSLVPGSTLETLEVINRVRFLLLLDANGDPDDGIEIGDRVQLLAESWDQVDFAKPDLEAELQAVIDDLSEGERPGVPDAVAARAHLLATLECVHAGAYWIEVGAVAQPEWGILTILPTEVDGVRFAGTVYGNSVNSSFVFSSSGTGLRFGDVSRLSFVDAAGERSVDARFVSSGNLEGELSTGESFVAYRQEASAPARYRFVAKLGYEIDNTWDIGLAIELVDESRVTATEYDMGWWDGAWNVEYEGRIDDGNVTLVSTADPSATLIGTVTLDTSPPMMYLAHAGEAAGALTAYGCRLN